MCIGQGFEGDFIIESGVQWCIYSRACLKSTSRWLHSTRPPVEGQTAGAEDKLIAAGLCSYLAVIHCDFIEPGVFEGLRQL